VGLSDPFHCTIDDVIKLEPVTVNVKPDSPISSIDGFNELRMGLGLELPVFPPPLQETARQTNTKDKERHNNLKFLHIKPPVWT
jgi:hypothetical protein